MDFAANVVCNLHKEEEEEDCSEYVFKTPIFHSLFSALIYFIFITFQLSSQTCYRFHSPTFVDLSAKFWEFSLNASTTISSYAFRVDDDIVSSDPGYLVSWTLYGSLGSSDGTAPTSPSDPSWVFVDAQTDVDFSSPETDLFTPGLPFRSSEVFYYPLNSSVTFQYFGFVGSVTPPLNSTVTFADPIIAVKFCS